MAGPVGRRAGFALVSALFLAFFLLLLPLLLDHARVSAGRQELQIAADAAALAGAGAYRDTGDPDQARAAAAQIAAVDWVAGRPGRLAQLTIDQDSLTVGAAIAARLPSFMLPLDYLLQRVAVAQIGPDGVVQLIR